MSYAWGDLDASDEADPCSFASGISPFAPLEVRIRQGEIVLHIRESGRFRTVDREVTRFRCAATERAIPGSAIVGLAYQRATRPAPPAVGADAASAALALLSNALRPDRIDRHFVSVTFREASGGTASATLYLEDGSADLLVESLARLAPVATVTRPAEASRLPADVPRTISDDPLGVLTPGIPIWDAVEIPLSDASGFRAGPDASIVVADDALWDVRTGARLARLPPVGSRELTAFTPDGRAIVLGGNSGAWNGRDAARAGSLSGVSVPDGAERFRIRDLPWLARIAVGPAGTHLAALHSVPPTVTLVSLDPGEVLWQSPVPAVRPVGRDGVDVWADAVLAFGRDWAGVWRLADGTVLFDPSPVLPKLPAADAASTLLGAWLLDSPLRLLLLYSAGVGAQAAIIEVASGEVTHTARITETQTPSTQLSADRSTWLVSSRAAVALWDTTALAVAGMLDGQQSGDRVAWTAFDESGRFAATAMPFPEGLPHHVMIWDVNSRTPIGQCLVNNGYGIALGRAGPTVLAGPWVSDRQTLTRCQPRP